MAGLASVKGRILAGQVVGLQEDIKRILGCSSSGEESQQIIRTCSRFVYENQNLDQQCFSSLLEIVSLCCEYHHEIISSDPFFHLRSMYYIILLAVRREEFHHHLVTIAISIEPYLELCDATSGEAQSMVRQMHQMLWNTSLTRSAPLEALTLQRFAFQCSLAVGNNLNQVCDQAVRVHTVYENTEKSMENSDQYFEAIFKYLIQALNKQSACDENSVIAIVGLITEYAKVAVALGKCSAFSRNNKVVVKLLEAHCDSKMVMGLKVGLKLPEVAIGLRWGKCGEEMLRKLMGTFGHVATLPGPNTVLVLGVLTTLTLLQPPHCSNLKLSSYLVELLMKRCRRPVAEDIARKVSSVLSQQVGSIFDMVNESLELDTLFTHVLALAETTKPFILGNFCGMGSLYNFGAHFGNFGSLAYRKAKYDVAAKFLELTVDFFDQCCSHSSDEQKNTVFLNLTKRVRLWSDALRYGGNHWEAGVAAGRGFIRGCITAEGLITMWVKCKRDAEKVGSNALKGMTVCEVVSEARRKYPEVEAGVVFDQAAALLLEIQCYRQQNYNTTEEQLRCGRLVANSSHGVENRVWGLLAVTEALWLCPDIVMDEQEAACATKQAKDLLHKAMAGGTNKPVLLELEALLHFWQYLCYIQDMYNKADVEVKEDKKPNPLIAQVKEPGEEEQVHDVCDVRPSSLLTLHTQHASLAPLQAALDIWGKFVSQDILMENAAMACASLTSVGYIYHLSGLVTPTIQAWGLLISLARRHSLQNYLIKGIVELMLTAPELVDPSLIGELEQMVTASAEASLQDTSQACLSLTASAATAFHYYRTGQYDVGIRLVQDALKSELMTKHTIKTTEVQTLVHLVASLYAWIPPWLLHPTPVLPAPCFSLALLACRQANALVLTALTESNKDVICWRHRVASLLLTTTAWLGHLSITTAQPRIARAYLEKSLKFSQQLILPLRIAEFLELLAQVDLLCDQLEDCRVKVDSLEALLKTHSPLKEELENLTPEFSKLAITKPAKVRKKKGPKIFCDPVVSGERMRTDSGVQDFSLNNLPPVFQIGPREAGSCSPSLDHRENIATVKFLPCPNGGVQCVICSAPVFHHLCISTVVLLALLHAHGKRFQSAHRCLDQAQVMYDDAAAKAHEVSAYMVSFLHSDIRKCIVSPSIFVHSRLNLVHLQTFHAKAECLALERKWEDALCVNLDSLQTLASLETQLLVQDMHFAAALALQGQALEKILAGCSKSPEGLSFGDISPPVVMGQEEDEVCTVTAVTTAVTPTVNTKRLDGNCTRTAQHLLNAPKHVNRKNLIFSIYSDEEEDVTEPARDVTPYRPIKRFFKSERKKPPSSVRKKENAENKILDGLAADWSDNLPSLVLKVPSDLPLSPLNNAPHCPSQPEGAKLELSTSPRSTSKTRSKPGPRTRASKSVTTRGKISSTQPQCPENVRSQGETGPSQGRSRTAKTASYASRTKMVTEPEPTKRTRASRSLRLI